jgi:predicted HTH transcriptional regulator
MLPQVLSDWSIDVVTDILATGGFETESFDFKETLPHSKDDAAKTRLRKTCCAFANSDGGFIVFGIMDDKSRTPIDRLVGLEPNIDLPEHFGNYPRSCSPSIYWTFLNPPLSLANGRVLHIIHIPKSWKAPHAVGDSDNGWHFMKRTNKGNEGMSIEEIRSRFLGYYEKRLKLQLLRSELATLRENAQTAYISNEGDIGEKYCIVTFDTHVIESIITDTYTITANETELLQALTGIRQNTRLANNKINMFLNIAMMPLSDRKAMVREHNEFLRPICERIESLCEKAMKELDVILRL